jgi:3-oxoacyl-[acyl-carrier-protein] synthase II
MGRLFAVRGGFKRHRHSAPAHQEDHPMRRVAVTGIGVVSPVGIGAHTFWSALIEGRSGIGPITRFDPSPFASRIAGEVRDFDPTAFLARRDVVRTDSFIHFALAATREAVEDAKLQISAGPDRMGVAIGSAIGGMPLLEATQRTLEREGPAVVSPYALPGFLPNMAAGWISMRTGARGPIATPATACAAGSQAIGDAYRMIQRGEADVMIAGGAEALITPLVVSCFCALRALSTHNEDPQRASRPFDKERDGFVLGEGAGILVLEALERARARGAHVYAEIAGYGLAADAHHPTTPTTDGPARAMALALADAALRPDSVGYINAHGTSTPINDANETRAIKQAFGDHAGRLAVSSTKSMTGHLIGAAGPIEAIATTLALERGLVPPTINYRSPDPECDLDYVPNVARRMDLDVALSNSFAFGGVNVALLFKKAVD